jgi:hypothetical protein
MPGCSGQGSAGPPGMQQSANGGVEPPVPLEAEWTEAPQGSDRQELPRSVQFSAVFTTLEGM